MANLYNIIEFLCIRSGIKPGKLCSETGISRGVLSDLKAGRSKSLSLANMQKIANYFHVSTDIFNEGVFEDALPNDCDMDDLFSRKAPTSEGERQEIPIDSGYFRIMQDAQKKGISPEDLKMAIEFFEKARRRDQE